MAIYNEYLNEELMGISDLKIKVGDIEVFF